MLCSAWNGSLHGCRSDELRDGKTQSEPNQEMHNSDLEGIFDGILSLQWSIE